MYKKANLPKKPSINPPSTDILYEQPVKTSNGYWGEPTGSIALIDNPNDLLSPFLNSASSTNGESTGSIALIDNPNNPLSNFLKFTANNN